MLLHAAAWVTPSTPQKLSWGGKGDCDGADSEQTSYITSLLFIPAEQNTYVADALCELSWIIY